MNWVRSNIRLASRLALFALAIQVMLSFGHYHAVATQGSLAIGAIADTHSAQQQPASDPDSDSSHDPCAICATIALASTALFATAPHLLLPQASLFLYLASAAEFVKLNSAAAAFQPRAPPVS